MSIASRSLVLPASLAILMCGVAFARAQQPAVDPFGLAPPTQKKPVIKVEPAGEAVATEAPPAVPRVGEPIVSNSAAHARIRRALDQPVQLHFVDSPLSEVVDFLKTTAAIPIVIDKRALDDVGLGSDTPVTFSVDGITLRSALRLLLHDLELTYVVRDEVLLITTPEAAETEVETRLYGVSEFAQELEPQILVTSPANRYQLLEQVLKTVIAPESWSDVGGVGSIAPFSQWGFLAISQTEESHEQIEAMLATLARARDAGRRKKLRSGGFPVMRAAELKAWERLEPALSSAVTWEFNEAPLSDVAEYMSDQHGVPVLIDVRALDDVGLGTDTPVTVSLSGISLRSALRLMLKELDLTYVAKDEVLMITTPEEAENELAIAVYSVGDFWKTSSPAAVTGPGRQFDSLHNLISTSIAPSTWDDVGGAGSIVQAVPWGLMVVSQTPQVHRQIEGLLSAARRVRALREQDVENPPAPEIVDGNPFAANTPRAVKSGEAMELRVYQIQEGISVTEVVKLIVGIIETTSWHQRPSQGDIYPVGQKLFIRQNCTVHQQIDQLLSAAGLKIGMGGGMAGGFFRVAPSVVPLSER